MELTQNKVGTYKMYLVHIKNTICKCVSNVHGNFTVHFLHVGCKGMELTFSTASPLAQWKKNSSPDFKTSSKKKCLCTWGHTAIINKTLRVFSIEYYSFLITTTKIIPLNMLWKKCCLQWPFSYLVSYTCPLTYSHTN